MKNSVVYGACLASVSVCGLLLAAGCAHRYEVSGLSCPTDRVQGVAVNVEPTLRSPEHALAVIARSTGTRESSWTPEAAAADVATWVQRDEEEHVVARAAARKTDSGWTVSGITRCD